MASDWESQPLFYMPIPHCPWCNSTKYIRVRTMPTDGDGSFTQRNVCSACSKRFLIVNETLPTSGKHIVWPTYDDANVSPIFERMQ